MRNVRVRCEAGTEYLYGIRLRRRNRGSISDRSKRCFSSAKCPEQVWDQPAPHLPQPHLLNTYLGGIRGCNIEHSPSSGAEGKNESAFISWCLIKLTENLTYSFT
jgi:hypothetical protein